MTRNLVSIIASLVDARLRCLSTGNEWAQKHESRIHALVREFLPSGAGFDNASTIYLDECTSDKLVFATSFHHMNDGGYYDGWTEHKIMVRPSLVHGFTLTVSGRDRNAIKDYIAETFHHALSTELTHEQQLNLYDSCSA